MIFIIKNKCGAKKIGMPITFHMPPWIFWGQSYFSYGKEVFLVEFLRKIRIFGFRPKNCVKFARKYLSNINEITLAPKEASRSPWWHMKDSRYTFFWNHIFYSKLNLGTRLDLIRSNGIVTGVWGRYTKQDHRS